MAKLSDEERFKLICQRKQRCVDWLVSAETIRLSLALMNDDVGDKKALSDVEKAVNALSKELWKVWEVYVTQMETPKNAWRRTLKEDV